MTSRVIQAFCLVIFILISSRVVILYQSERVVAGEELALKQELETLLTRRHELTAEIASLSTDRGVEEEIRERYGVVKEGEKVINLVGEIATTTIPIAPDSWWQVVWNKIFGE